MQREAESFGSDRTYTLASHDLSKYRTALACPALQASMSGVIPLLSWASILAPHLNRVSMHGTLPMLALKCRGERWLWLRTCRRSVTLRWLRMRRTSDAREETLTLAMPRSGDTEMRCVSDSATPRPAARCSAVRPSKSLIVSRSGCAFKSCCCTSRSSASTAPNSAINSSCRSSSFAMTFLNLRFEGFRRAFL